MFGRIRNVGTLLLAGLLLSLFAGAAVAQEQEAQAQENAQPAQQVPVAQQAVDQEPVAQAPVVQERVTPPPAQQPPVQETPSQISINTPPSQQDIQRGRPVSLDVQNAEISTVLRSLASFSGANIVASPRVTGKVTVKLEDVPWVEALGVILRAHSFDYVEENGIYRVDTAEELRQESLAQKKAQRQVAELTELQLGKMTLRYASAEESRAALEEMLTQRGTIDVDVRTNSLLINDIPERVALIEEMARQLDSQTPQVEINARLIDIDTKATQELGITWGISNFRADGNNIVGGAGVNSALQDPAGSLMLGSVQSYGDLLMKVEALERDNRAKLISNPVLTTTDNREARILVGQKIPLIVADEAGNAITQLTTIGIQLAVTPHINGEETITLDIHNEISDLSSEATVQGGVIINTNESDTRVVVDNGETAIIAGLIRDVESYFTSGVPVLKDIPLLGALFRHSSKTNAARELVIFVTPRIVTEQYLARDRLTSDSTLVISEENDRSSNAAAAVDLR
jgi:type IV pilus assembly protein PilQ